MDQSSPQKTSLYLFSGLLLLILAGLVNPFTANWFLSIEMIPLNSSAIIYDDHLLIFLPTLLDLICICLALLILMAKKPLTYYLNNSFVLNLGLFFLLFSALFSINVIETGNFNLFRIFYLVLLLYFLSKSYSLRIVKKEEGKALKPIIQNLATFFFALLFLFILLEGCFLFYKSTHRFNGTLASRAWFESFWKVNQYGYRDDLPQPADDKKKKIMVLGDSFVAGHGIKDPKDRFPDQLQSKLSANQYRVYNMGVGGADTEKEFKRLKEFPKVPDILILSWFANDIDLAGEKSGLKFEPARSYSDIPNPFRYFVRRSYFLNFLYWRVRHPGELSDYAGFLKQCFANENAMNFHFRELDRFIDYADSLQIPFAVVVFPFLENAEGSGYATDPIEKHFAARNVPVLSVKKMLVGKPANDFIVNQNDPHPNEKLNAMVADSLFGLLNRKGWVNR